MRTSDMNTSICIRKKTIISKKWLLIMRLSFITVLLLLLTLNLLWAAPGSGQSIENVKVEISLRGEPLQVAFEQIERQTGFKFAYVESQVAVYHLSLKKESRSVKRTLDLLLANTALKYMVRNSTVVILPKENAAINENGERTDVSRMSPDNKEVVLKLGAVVGKVVSGTVSNEAGEPLAGASISVKQNGRGTLTDSRGQFSIEVPDDNAVLVISYAGFVTKETTVGRSNTVAVSLTSANKMMEDVLVIGYGNVKRSDVTGSVAKIGEAAVKATPIVALDRAMQGRVPGVQVTTNSSRPGGSTTVRIRGTGSVNANNEPLYVIDGYPTGDLNSINPNDIESIDILKDASATAIYGSRGSNGVVLVTTKRGKANQSNIQFETYQGSQSVRRKIPLLNAREYAEFINEARINGGGTAYFDGSNADRPLPSSFGEGTDWQDQIFRTAPIQNYQLTIAGGEAKTRYAISGSYFDQSGIITNSRFKRYTLRANLDRDISSRIKVGLSMQGAFINSDRVRTEADANRNAGVTTAAVNYPAIFPAYNADGSYFKDQTTLNPFPVDNPLAIANLIKDKGYSTRILSNLFADIKIIEGLNFRTSVGGDLISNKNNYYVSRQLLLSSLIGSAAVNADQNLNWLTENTLTFNRTFSDRHKLNGVLGYTAQGFHYEGATANSANFNNDFASFYNLGAGATLQAPSSSVVEWALISYLSRVNYSFDNRYLVTLTARRDGSSRFGPSNKFGFFPSGAFAWRVSNEKFMSGVKAINDLKFRVSYGLTGNQAIGDYQFLSSLLVSSYAFGGPNASVFVGSTPSGVSNLDLRWEKNKQLDIGADMAFLNNRIRLTVDYYNKQTSDLLFLVNIPASTGYTNSLRNIGSVENKGWEFALGTTNVNGKDFQWTSDFNISFNKNKVLRLDGRPEFTSGLGNGDLQITNPILLKVGEPLGSFYGRVMSGIFQNQGEVDKSAQKNAKPGDIRYEDLNGDGVINDNDRKIIGNGYPKFFGGLDNTISYKGFDVNIFFQGSYGNKILNLSRFELYGLNGQNQAKEIVNRWTPTNPSNTVPRANTAGGQKILSTFQVEDGSYLRLKNLSLGYHLPQSVLRRVSIKGAKVYVSAQNLLTFTNYTGYDPEVSRWGSSAISQAMDLGSYPSAKTLLVGVNLTF